MHGTPACLLVQKGPRPRFREPKKVSISTVAFLSTRTHLVQIHLRNLVFGSPPSLSRQPQGVGHETGHAELPAMIEITRSQSDHYVSS